MQAFQDAVMQLNRAENTGTSNAQIQELFLQKAEESGRLP